jgi:hypothetical protein
MRGSGEASAARCGREVCPRWCESGVEPGLRGWILAAVGGLRAAVCVGLGPGCRLGRESGVEVE